MKLKRLDSHYDDQFNNFFRYTMQDLNSYKSLEELTIDNQCDSKILPVLNIDLRPLRTLRKFTLTFCQKIQPVGPEKFIKGSEV